MTRVGTGYDYTVTPPHTFMGHSRMEVENLREGCGPNTKAKGTKLNNQMERPNQSGKKKKGKTRKKDTFSQETLSPIWIAKGQQSVVIDDKIVIRKIK